MLPPRHLICAFLLASASLAADRPQWGSYPSRNMVSEEKNLPPTFDPATGKHIKWSTQLGTETHSTPVVANGKILIGTNNNHPRDPRHFGDRGVLMCFNEADGKFLWQLVVPKLEDDRYLDWPNVGFASPATIDGDRADILTNRGEAVCLDLSGLANGNDGPYMDEGKHMALRGNPPMEVGPLDADILWLTDFVSHPQIGIHPHDQIHASMLIDGDFIYLNSSNGVDNTHRKIRRPDAPSFVVLDKKTGRLLAKDDERIGPRVFHATWSSPSMATIKGKRLVAFGGGDGIVYAFEALASLPPEGEVQTLKRVIRFDPDPSAPKQEVHRWTSNRRESPSIIHGMPVFHDNRIYVTVGGDLWWGKKTGWLKCIDATKTGDTTTTAELWSYPTRQIVSTPAVHDGLVFIADCNGIIHCVDAATGKPHWTHESKGEVWASCLVADGKVYLGMRNGTFFTFAASKDKQLLCEVHLNEPISGTATPANGVLYLASMSRLYALQNGAGK